MRKLRCLPPCVQDIFEIPEGVSYYEQLCNITGNLINTMNLLNETVQVTIPKLREDMENGDKNLQNQIDTINNETIPELKAELENKIDTQDKALQDQIDVINDTTIPNLKTELENKIDTQDQELQEQIDTINETTIPELEDRLNNKIETADTNLQNQINTINQTTIPDLEERLNTKIEEGDSNLQGQITAVKTFTESQVNDFDFGGSADTIKINKYSSRERDTVLANGNNSIHLEGDDNITLQATLSAIEDNYHDVTIKATIKDKNIVDSNLKPNVKYANDNDSELVTNASLSVANNTITFVKSTIAGGEVVENSNSVNLVAGDNVSISTEGDNVTISSTGGGGGGSGNSTDLVGKIVEYDSVGGNEDGSITFSPLHISSAIIEELKKYPDLSLAFIGGSFTNGVISGVTVGETAPIRPGEEIPEIGGYYMSQEITVDGLVIMLAPLFPHGGTFESYDELKFPVSTVNATKITIGTSGYTKEDYFVNLTYMRLRFIIMK